MLKIKTRLPKISSLIIAMGFVASSLLFASPVHAAFPGQNGKIVFYTNRDGNNEIYTMNADGSGQTNLTNNPANDSVPNWSSDGKKIVFTSNRDGNNEIYVMNADGTGQTRLTNNTASDSNAAWSPDNTKITFDSDRDGNSEIYTMNANGTNQTRLTTNAALDFIPKYSPNGTKIAFSSFRGGSSYEIYTMNPDGSNQTQLSNNTAVYNFVTSYSPDGTKIAFSRAGPPPDYTVFTMNSDGTGRTQLTNNVTNDSEAAYSPDGANLVFVSNRDGNFEIYKMGTDGSNPIRLTNTAGDERSPSWQPLTIPPNAVDDSGVAIAFNTTKVIDVLANDTADPYGPLNAASVTVTVQPANGTTSVNTTSGAITYTPRAGFTGNDSFTYRVCSSASATLCDTAVVSITVNPLAPGTGFTLSGTKPLLTLGVAGLSAAALFVLAGRYKKKMAGQR